MQMNLHVIASGSSGNCYMINNNGHYIFIDAGATLTAIKKSLDNIKIAEKVSLFVTHEHNDHISGIMPLIKSFSPKIYSSYGTASYLEHKGVPCESIYTINDSCIYDMGDFTVTPFKIFHDAAEPFGYKFDFGNTVISFATDLGIVTDDLYKTVEGSTVLLLESNYEDELLKENKKYPEYLKQRIRSKYGHLSNKDAFQFAGELSKNKLKNCFLGHVSENNNSYELLEKYADAYLNTFNIETKVLRQKQKEKTVFNI